jgi:hypothetical protein
VTNRLKFGKRKYHKFLTFPKKKHVHNPPVGIKTPHKAHIFYLLIGLLSIMIDGPKELKHSMYKNQQL